jgi:pyruvate phosphate dikinase-like enzyme
MKGIDWREAADRRTSRFQDFQDLMRHRVQEILLVASPYDSFILEEDGRLDERIVSDFLDLDLRVTPAIHRVPSASEALALARDRGSFDLIITTTHVGDINAASLAREAKSAVPGLPVVLLAYDHRELSDFVARNDVSAIDGIFLWQGDARILLAIVKYVEDRLNVAHDTQAAGVQVIIVVEDNVRNYSSFLPVIYTELLKHSHRVIAEGVNLSHKIMRTRARPKILLCSTFEEAWKSFTGYEEHILGVISDVEFPREGRLAREAGVELARMVKERRADVPIILHSSHPENAGRASSVGASFLLKGSPLLLEGVRRFMVESLSFGDFVFRLPDGREVDRAGDLKTLEEKLETVPGESLAFHGERNHFSNWLKARTEFALAERLRPRKVSDFATHEDLRRNLVESIAAYRREQGRDIIADFDRGSFDASGDFYRLGGGSLGGKARGLAFIRQLVQRYRIEDGFPGVRLRVPPAVVVGTAVFDRFLEDGDLRDRALRSTDDAEIRSRFLAAPFPEEARLDLAAFLDRVSYPIAVRSSSLLEDSQYQPFTGVYETYMLANDHPDAAVRLDRLIRAVKLVYASTFYRQAKDYLRATPYRLEEDKMAVILQKIVGERHGDRFYPDFAGVARSHNFYPTPPLKSEDGIVAAALGLGRTVVEGGNCLRFSPRYPRHLVQFSSVADILKNSQRQFWSLRLGATDREGLAIDEALYDLDAAEADGTLSPLASTWSPENEAVYEGVSRPGIRLVSFAPILSHGLFPLAAILQLLLEIGPWGMNSPVEIEFAVDLSPGKGRPQEFALLQMRPLAISRETEALEIDDVEDAGLICRSSNVLGNGRLEGIRDVIVVDHDRYERRGSLEAAQAVARFNADLAAERRAYVLIGVGRWGSADPWLGIPVTWPQISGARAIVEAGFRDFRVTPSQGTHFFQNLTSFNVGYFTVNPEAGEGFVDWKWLSAQRPAGESGCVRHLRFDDPIVVTMNGRKNIGVIFKPGA